MHPKTYTLCEVGGPKDQSLLTYSPYCDKVHRVLRFAGIPYERNVGAHPGVFKKYNPLGKVPVLLADQEAITDSTKIIKFLVQQHPDTLGYFDTDANAAESWLWEEFADTVLNGYLVGSRWADEENWPRLKQALFGPIPAPIRMVISRMTRKRIVQSLRSREVWYGDTEDLRRRFSECIGLLEERTPQDGFWLGERPLSCDFAIFAQLNSLRCAISPWQWDEIKKHTKLNAYLDRVLASTEVE